MKTKGILIALLVLLIVPSLQAQDDPCMATGGFWNEDTERCNISTGLDIEINYPPMEAEFAATIIQDFINALQTDIVTMYAEVYDPVWEHFPWALDVNFELYQFSESMVSYNFNVYQYTGGAHPNTFFATFTFDLENERVLGFDDLFVEGVNPLETIAPIVQGSLEAQLAEYDPDLEWIADGTGMNPDNYQNFVVTEEELIFFFPPYQVAAYAFGPQQVNVPLSALNSILAAPFRAE